jgi:hypothetical protein
MAVAWKTCSGQTIIIIINVRPSALYNPHLVFKQERLIGI